MAPASNDRGTAAVGGAIDDHGPLGVNANLYLNRRVPRLVVEMDAVKGFEPSPTAINTLTSRLESVVDKPGGVDVLLVETFTDGRETWTDDDLRQVEERNRDHYSTKDVMILYVLYVDGSRAEAADALGVAYSSSTYAVFAERIREAAATPLIPAVAIEQAVIVHEMGHVLALVNIGYDSPRDHEDSDHEYHSKNVNSVMYWAVDNVGVANLLGGRPSPPTDFDADDRADLEDIKNGRLRVERS
jgi:hypothetical protein